MGRTTLTKPGTTYVFKVDNATAWSGCKPREPGNVRRNYLGLLEDGIIEPASGAPRPSRRRSHVTLAKYRLGALRRLRIQRGLRRGGFAGISAKEIARIERGEVAKPHADTLARLAQRLGVKAEEIDTYPRVEAPPARALGPRAGAPRSSATSGSCNSTLLVSKPQDVFFQLRSSATRTDHRRSLAEEPLRGGGTHS
jgi:transcriptional regulator with XRE-family HTH domain